MAEAVKTVEEETKGAPPPPSQRADSADPLDAFLSKKDAEPDPLDQLAAMARGDAPVDIPKPPKKKSKKKDLLSDLPDVLAGLVTETTSAKAPTRRVVKRTKFTDGLDDPK